MPQCTICATTATEIDGFLEAYVQNIVAFDRTRGVAIIIAGDRKSPRASSDIARQYCQQGLDVRFLSLERQADYLKRFPDVAAMIPENSDNRRNVAYLMALEEGADVVVSVDDDNLPIDGTDFVGEHLLIGHEASLPEAVGHEGWYNLCDLLDPKIPGLYPRGFPYWARHPETNRIGQPGTGRIGINVGLWRGDPDSDAIARLYGKPHIDAMDGRSVMLGRGVRCPINTQNTALSREAMAAYYYVRMGEPLRGMRLDRFGDIFSGYFLQVCADAVGDRIRIGTPLADHRRNQHNLLVDLYQELAGIMILEDLSRFLSKVPLPAESYATAYRLLAGSLEAFAHQQEGFIWTEETKAYFGKIARYMRIWVDAVESV